MTGIVLWDGYSTITDKVSVCLAGIHTHVLTFLQRNGTDTVGHLGGIVAGILYYRYLRMRPF